MMNVRCGFVKEWSGVNVLVEGDRLAWWWLVLFSILVGDKRGKLATLNCQCANDVSLQGSAEN